MTRPVYRVVLEHFPPPGGGNPQRAEMYVRELHQLDRALAAVAGAMATCAPDRADVRARATVHEVTPRGQQRVLSVAWSDGMWRNAR